MLLHIAGQICVVVYAILSTWGRRGVVVDQALR